MVDTTNGTAAAAAPEKEDSFFEQLSMMARAFRASPLRNLLYLLYGGILAVIVATAFGQILLNRWNQPFYDALERRDMQGFLAQLQVFAMLAGGLLVLNVGQTWLNQMLHLKLREGLTRDLIGEWMVPRRAFHLANAGAIGVNPDQRLHEDARHLADLSADLGIGLLQAGILLVSFVGVLWALSSDFAFQIGGRSYAVPGYMVWAALIYVGTASLLSWLVGQPLIRLNSERYAREAELRFSFMRVNEHVDGISLAGGEADERRRLELDLASVLDAARRIVTASVRLTWVTAGYGWTAVVAPVVIASPIYFAGDLSFGGLMMAAAAFTQVNASLRWFIDNIGAIADWRATLLRVASFRSALVGVDRLHGVEERIAFTGAEGGRLVLDGIEVASAGGCTRLVEGSAEIVAGERVRITGGPGSGKTLFFRAMAGLWPWGAGRIALPQDQAVIFVPGEPYIPRGSLRDVLCYPLGAAAFAQPDLVAALTKVGLGRLADTLDKEARWDRDLGEDDQRLVAFARLILHRPRWIVIDEAFDLMQADARRRVLSLFQSDLPDAAILVIGGSAIADALFTRVLHLAFDPEGRCLSQPGSAATS